MNDSIWFVVSVDLPAVADYPVLVIKDSMVTCDLRIIDADDGSVIIDVDTVVVDATLSGDDLRGWEPVPFSSRDTTIGNCGHLTYDVERTTGRRCYLFARVDNGDSLAAYFNRAVRMSASERCKAATGMVIIGDAKKIIRALAMHPNSRFQVRCEVVLQDRKLLATFPVGKGQ